MRHRLACAASALAVAFAGFVVACSSFGSEEADEPRKDAPDGASLVPSDGGDPPDVRVVDATPAPAPSCNGAKLTDDFERAEAFDPRWAGHYESAGGMLSVIADPDPSNKVLAVSVPAQGQAFLQSDVSGAAATWDACISFTMKLPAPSVGPLWAIRLLGAPTKAAIPAADFQALQLKVLQDGTVELAQDDFGACPGTKTCTNGQTTIGSLADRKPHRFVLSVHATEGNDGYVDVAFDGAGSRIELSVALAEQAYRELRLGLHAPDQVASLLYDDVRIDTP